MAQHRSIIPIQLLAIPVIPGQLVQSPSELEWQSERSSITTMAGDGVATGAGIPLYM